MLFHTAQGMGRILEWYMAVKNPRVVKNLGFLSNQEALRVYVVEDFPRTVADDTVRPPGRTLEIVEEGAAHFSAHILYKLGM